MAKKRKRKKKNDKLLFIFLIIIIIISGIIIYYINNKESELDITLTNNLDIEVNSEVKVSSLIKNIENLELKDKEQKVDTSKIGKKKITITLISDKEKEERYTFEVTIVDTEKPEIECEDKITISTGDEVDLLTYITAIDNYDKELDIKVNGEYDNNTNGEYNLSYVVKDSSGNENKKEFTLVVEAPKYKKMKDKTITTSKGYTLKIKNGLAYIDDILIVNKTYYLPENYTPVDSYAKLSDSCPNCLEKEVMTAFNEMKAQTTSIGLNIYIASGYRSYNTQNYLYNNYVARDGKEEADTYSARPGHSEHQTGLAFDLNSVNSSFANTDEGKWIKDNCYLYGFIIRYPKGKESITGYMYEPWHLRYVGKDLAEKLYNNGDWLTIEEYFGITSIYEG